MKQNINLYKIANLYITLLLPLKKIIKGNAFCSKEAGKIFRNKRNASAQQKKWEISGIYFRCSGMLVLTTTIQMKMLICSHSSIFKKNLLAFSSKKGRNSLPSVKSQRSYEWNAFGIAEETPFKLALLELPIVTIQTMYNKHKLNF